MFVRPDVCTVTGPPWTVRTVRSYSTIRTVVLINDADESYSICHWTDLQMLHAGEVPVRVYRQLHRQVVGLRDRAAIIRALCFFMQFPPPSLYAGYGDLIGVGS